MDIEFADQDLRDTCEQTHVMMRLGKANARKLQRRLADLQAAMTVGELIAGNPHPLKGDMVGHFSLRLDGGVRLVFEPADEPVPTQKDGSIAWRMVTKVRIVFIGDYHD